VTKRRDGVLAIAVWNLVDPDKTGATKNVRLVFRGLKPNLTAHMSAVDNEHGNTLAAYRAMGSPMYPTVSQIDKLNAATALRPLPAQTISGGELNVTLEPNALLLIEIPGG